MKVLYISEIYPDPKTGVGVWGGGERQFYEISRRVKSAQNGVKVLTCRFPKQASRDSVDGVEVLRQGLSRDPATGGVLKSPLGVLAYIARTLSQALRADCDLIHCNAYYPIIAGRLASAFKGVPLVATVHDLPTAAEWGAHVGSRGWGAVGLLATRLSLMLADGPVICVSGRVKTKLLRAGRREVYVIPNGVDVTLFDAVEAQERSGQVLYVGRLVSYKHVDTLLAAFAEVLRRVPGSSLVVVGDGPERESLEAKAEELGVRDKVSFRGTVKSNLEVVKIYRESAVFVLPSVLEGEGLAVKEAMAARVPVVAVDSPGSGIADVVKDGVNGYLVPPEEAGPMADRVAGLLLDPGERARVGSEGRKGVERWTWDQATAETMSVYESALGGLGRRH
ncbi:MAG: glycosyltransferase family 4 protein [Nitrososphaerota archaeon]|nr:glycosyltransferase family 4 protein [Nitrososphaerota archaeon]